MGADIADLWHACLKLLQVPAELAAVYRRPWPPPFWLVSQANARVEAVLLEQPDIVEFAAFLPAMDCSMQSRNVSPRGCG